MSDAPDVNFLSVAFFIHLGTLSVPTLAEDLG